jgi:hypothetical protein
MTSFSVNLTIPARQVGKETEQLHCFASFRLRHHLLEKMWGLEIGSKERF